MPQTLTSAAWVEAIARHYFVDYLPEGGSSVKFAVCYDGIDQRDVATRLRTKAASLGLLVADIDAAQTKVHMIEQIFARVADQIPWNKVIDRTLSRFAEDSHWLIPDNFTDESVVEQLDRLNQLGSQQISLVMQRHIVERILLNHELAKDFRVAMQWLARARLEGGPTSATTYQHLTDWLGGRIRLINELKQYQIFSKVVRANARHLFGSLLAMIREAGYPGLVVTLNCSRMLNSQRANDGSVHYTKAALFDAYEVFREFVDSTDLLDGLFFSVFLPLEFLEITNSHGRGISLYPALQYRVQDEIRSQKHANPLTAMTRISDMPESSI